MPILKNIYDVAKKAGITKKYVIPYGKDKAKIDLSIHKTLKKRENGKLVLVTAITPSKAGEGKTTTSIALCDGLAKINEPSLLCLREPSLGPVFGIKGGATGGGKASLVPSEDINLHFTGDMHALTSAINLISAIIDNHIYQGNVLQIDPSKIVWKRALDMNDRALRSIIIANDDSKSTPRHEEFVITVASEMMAILCLATSEKDFIERINNIVVAYNTSDEAIKLSDLKISHAVTKLMKNVFNPNLVQTMEGNPCFVHGGPFANIAHGCNSLFATQLALKLAPLVITEAGFASDLGAEKFFDIKCRVGNLHPDAVVLVATIRALKLHGGVDFENVNQENVDALLKGLPNLKQHLENIAKYNVPAVVCINHFESDTKKETSVLKKWCLDNGYEVAFCDSFNKGGDGAIELAELVKKTLKNKKSDFHPLYDLNTSIKEKINLICQEIYRAKGVKYTDEALEQIEKYEKMGFTKTPICIAKTPLSFSDNPKLLGTPRDFDITIREVRLSAGAGFLVPLAGSVMTMPGLPKVPAAVKMEDLSI
ncbi:MAG: formate--tetrahydrofolate ligase [Bacilli bacterium]|jgi:formate--tetrahydrofolate ligase|nr:formate--tetrahydrofolate ligase [Bacilli bacterium]